MKVLVCALLSAVAVSGRPQQDFGAPQPRPPAYDAPQRSSPRYRPPQQGYGEENYAPAQYDFQWEVNDPESGNEYSHQESRDGDSTQGEYSVLLPDGRLMRVVYSVIGDQGYVADVQFEGEPQPYQPGGGYNPPQQYRPSQQYQPEPPQQYQPQPPQGYQGGFGQGKK